MSKYICTECNKEIPECDLNESVYEVDERTAPVYQLIMGLNPESNISKFKILTHEILTYRDVVSVHGHVGICAEPPKVHSCGPIKRKR